MGFLLSCLFNRSLSTSSFFYFHFISFFLTLSLAPTSVTFKANISTFYSCSSFYHDKSLRILFWHIKSNSYTLDIYLYLLVDFFLFFPILDLLLIPGFLLHFNLQPRGFFFCLLSSCLILFVNLLYALSYNVGN